MSGERKALIVAVDQYEQEGLRDLLAPAADAEALAQVLGDSQIGGFTVDVVRNEPSHVIQAQIDDLFSESRPDDVLLLHFSCHGLKSDSGELFFAAANTRPNRLSSTAVSADFVQRCMRASRSRSIVLLLDCCYGGAFAQGVTVRAAGDVNVLDSFPKERGGGRGRAVITASTAMEYAFEGEHLTDDQHRRPSLFTNALTEGLATGDADRDEDGWVSLNELYEYVFDKVRERNPHQTPSRQVEMEGDLYLARSRRRRIQAAPIPADLQAAMTDPNMYTRLGAVSELQARLTGDNLAAAAGAFEALEALRNDVRYIAVPAVAALTEATVRPDPTEVRFGTIEQGSTPPRQRVQLLGPPIARACTLRPSHDWIRVYETADGFDVSFDTGRPGRLQGSVAVKAPTGQAVVSVEVDCVAAADPRLASPAREDTIPAPAPSAPLSGPEAALVLEPTPVPAAVPEPVAAAAPETVPARPAQPGLASATASTPAAELKPETTPAPAREPKAAPATSVAAGAAPAKPVPGPARPSRIRRWLRGPDRPVARAAGAVVLAGLLALEAADFYGQNVALAYSEINVAYWRIVLVLAIVGILVAAFEMPPRWPTTIVHLVNSVFFVVLSLVFVSLHGTYYDPANGRSGTVEVTLLGGTIAYGIVALCCGLTIRRTERDRDENIVSITGLVTVGLIVIGAALITVSAFRAPTSMSQIGTAVLLAAALASLLTAAVLLVARHRPGTPASR